MDKKVKASIWYFVIALLATLYLHDVWVQGQQSEPIPYSQFQADLRSGKIQEISVSSNSISGVYKQPLPDGKKRFTTTRVDPALAQELSRYPVKYTGVQEGGMLASILSWVLPLALFYAFWSFAFRRFSDRQGMGGLMAIGKSKARVYVETDTKVTFKDVAGVDEAKDELREVVAFLKDPQQYGRLGAHVPKGVLLVGPPGTGKTLLARAVAGEAGVPFFSINGSEFVEMFVGVGAARVRDLFEQARQKAPAIIFIDELDALGRARGASPFTGGEDEKEQTLNQLLANLDGFDPRDGLVLLAATNRPEILDPALLRAGRFDRQILVDRPDKIGRVQILNVHLKKIVLGADADPEKIAALTPGFSGADLANLVNEAALLATRRNADTVSLDDFTAAVERIVAGLEKRTRVLSPTERRIVAYHEMGHALVAMSLPGVDPVQKVSIIPRGISALGYNMQRPEEERYILTQAELENRLAAMLGGRAAEHLVFGHLSTGAADDMAKATGMARSMVTRYGMDAKLGAVAYETDRAPFLATPQSPQWSERQYSEETAYEIDRAICRITAQAFERAVNVLASHREQLERGAQLLLEKETLGEDELLLISTGIAQVPADATAAGGQDVAHNA
jgi:cell division protease FtsH